MSHPGNVALTVEQATIPKDNIWRKLPIPLAIIGIAGVALAYLTGADDQGSPQFWYSYLTSYMFWLSLGLGGLFFVLIHHATRAGWSAAVRRIAENFMITLPLMGLLGLVIVFGGMHTLYEWSHPEVVENDLMIQAKEWWLNSGFFTIRAVLYLALWTILGGALYRWSTKQDHTGDEALSHKMRWWAPIGIVVFALTLTLAAVDFMMSLDPHWYSTIFGVYYFGGTVMAINAAMALTAMGLQRSGVLKDHITQEHYHDLGKMTFAFVVFWSYIAFSQFMLIWYANIPEETIWFAHRVEGGWEWITLVLALLHFIVPFFFLMSRHIKRRTSTFFAGAVLVLFAHFIDMFWLVQPTMEMHHGGGHPHFSFHIADVLAFIGIGGLFLAVVTWGMGRAAVAAVKDPRLTESLAFENQNY